MNSAVACVSSCRVPALWRADSARGLAGHTHAPGRDQHDAFSIAAWPSRTDRNGSLTAFMKPGLTPPECAR
jgi:hypothetical protein